MKLLLTVLLFTLFVGLASAETKGKKKPQVVCRQVPYQEKRTTTKSEYVSQNYDCSEFQTQCNTVEKTCYQTAYRDEPYDCSETTYETVCQQSQLIAAPTSKYRTLSRRQSYNKKLPPPPKKTPPPPPKKAPPPPVCNKVPKTVARTCIKSVSYEEAQSCTEEQCKDVQVLKTCTKQVLVEKPHTYTATSYRQECYTPKTTTSIVLPATRKKSDW